MQCACNVDVIESTFLLKTCHVDKSQPKSGDHLSWYSNVFGLLVRTGSGKHHPAMLHLATLSYSHLFHLACWCSNLLDQNKDCRLLLTSQIKRLLYVWCLPQYNKYHPELYYSLILQAVRQIKAPLFYGNFTHYWSKPKSLRRIITASSLYSCWLVQCYP